MRASRRMLLVLTLVVLFGAFACWLFLTDHFPARGIYPAGSKIEDKEAPGGFGPSENPPKELARREWGEAGAVSLVAFPDELVAYGKRQGFAVRLINRTDAPVAFSACDSCLYLTQEARDSFGNWRAIELPPQMICGNSYHRVFLDKNQYWEFPARRSSGVIKTRLRFRLEQGTSRREEWDAGEDGQKHVRVFADRGGRVIYSNEFEGWVNTSLSWLAHSR
jgi:hypothetical protein